MLPFTNNKVWIVMLFTQQVFHLECYFLLTLFDTWIVTIKSQPGVSYKSVVYIKEACISFAKMKK